MARFLAAPPHDHTVWVWQVEDGLLDYRLGGHSQKVNTVAFSPDGKYLVSGSNDGKVNVWRRSGTGEHEDKIQLLYVLDHGDWVTSLDFDPSSQHLMTGSFDSRVAVWDLATAKLAGLLFDQNQNQVLSLDVAENGAGAAAGTVQGEVYYWDEIDLVGD